MTSFLCSAEEDVNDHYTILTSHENPIQEMPVTDRYQNFFDNQIKITIVLYSPTRSKTQQLFPNKKQLHQTQKMTLYVCSKIISILNFDMLFSL